MNDLGQRLRDEARHIRSDMPATLSLRIRAALAVAPSASAAARRPVLWLPIAAAAALLVAASFAWVALHRNATVPTQAVAVAIPAPLGISDLMQAAQLAGQEVPRHDEIDALSLDLAAAARTVRGALPF
jgi:hypothetical protein